MSEDNMIRLFGSILIITFLAACGGGGDGSSSNTPAPKSTPWLIPETDIADGGPGKDGIPALDAPTYLSIGEASFYRDNDLVIGTLINGIARAYPHIVLNWHEIVNVETMGDYHTLSYCPLTGTSDLWTVPDNFTNKTFGVSGLLYNSNLILYDRETDSNWPQMLTQSANGTLIRTLADKNVVVETNWGTWKLMYPDTLILSNSTGISRDYTAYPYGGYLTNAELLFSVSNSDLRLHPKTRVLGINSGGVNKAFVIGDFANTVEVINEGPANAPYVVVGSSGFNFAIAFDSTLSDGTELTFSVVEDAFPVVMQDDLGNQWNIFGTAISGPNAEAQLTLRSDFIAFWFAWVAFFPNPQIHGS